MYDLTAVSLFMPLMAVKVDTQNEQDKHVCHTCLPDAQDRGLIYGASVGQHTQTRGKIRNEHRYLDNVNMHIKPLMVKAIHRLQAGKI